MRGFSGVPGMGPIREFLTSLRTGGNSDMDKKQNLKQWPKGVSGNPGGRPKHDLAAEIARVVFESDPEAVRKAFLTRLRRGDSRAFAVLADRGYGKLTEHLTMDATVAAGVVERLASARARVDSDDEKELPEQPQNAKLVDS